jgi:hypothetical protein
MAAAVTTAPSLTWQAAAIRRPTLRPRASPFGSGTGRSESWGSLSDALTPQPKLAGKRGHLRTKKDPTRLLDREDDRGADPVPRRVRKACLDHPGRAVREVRPGLDHAAGRPRSGQPLRRKRGPWLPRSGRAGHRLRLAARPLPTHGPRAAAAPARPFTPSPAPPATRSAGTAGRSYTPTSPARPPARIWSACSTGSPTTAYAAANYIPLPGGIQQLAPTMLPQIAGPPAHTF